MMDAATIIAALGGNPSTGKCFCPAHNEKTPSLQVTDRENTVLVYCHGGCSQSEVIAALKARGLWGGRASEPKRREDVEKDETQQLAYKILHSAAQARCERDALTPAAYLQGRGIKIVPPTAMILPEARSAHYLNNRFPAMVCPVADKRGVIGAHVTLLTRDGKAKSAARTPRKMYGPTKGGYIRLSVANPDLPLVVGEGVESSLAAMEIAESPRHRRGISQQHGRARAAAVQRDYNSGGR